MYFSFFFERLPREATHMPDLLDVASWQEFSMSAIW
jgi:hypothetical protein